MGQCVLRDCGLEHPNPPSHLQDYLKQHLQDQYFDNFLKKNPSNQAPIQNVDFNSSMEYTPKPNILHTMLPKPKPKLSKTELKTSNSTQKELMTEKIMPLMHNHKLIEENFPKFENQNYKPTTSDIGYAYDEDFLGGSLEIMNEEKINNHQKSKFFESMIRPTEQNTSNIFQNQIFDNMNTTPSGHYRSDEDNLEEYQKIFQDDEFDDDTYEEDYIKKLKKEGL